MPSIITGQGIVHYEVIGSGPPVILIHGYTQSWNTWRSTIEHFGKRYRMYAPDLWGFGDSDKERRTSFQVTDFVELIPQFMDALGMIKVPIMGHSMGGTTALGVALKYPERVKKVAVVGSPIKGTSLSPFLQLMSIRMVANLMLSGPNQPLMRSFIRAWSYFVSRPNPDLFYNMFVGNAKYSLDSFVQSIASLRAVDLRADIPQIRMPALGVFGARDVIVHPNQEKLFKKLIPNSQTIWLPKAGHFPMWDTPETFYEAVEYFMEKM